MGVANFGNGLRAALDRLDESATAKEPLVQSNTITTLLAIGNAPTT